MKRSASRALPRHRIPVHYRLAGKGKQMIQLHTKIEKKLSGEMLPELAAEFRRIAKCLCKNDRAMQEDLIQEMALAVLCVRGVHSWGYYVRLGRWRARDYLRRFGAPAGGTYEDIERARDLAAERED